MTGAKKVFADLRKQRKEEQKQPKGGRALLQEVKRAHLASFRSTIWLSDGKMWGWRWVLKKKRDLSVGK